MRRAGNVAGIGQKKSKHRDWVYKPEGQRALERLCLADMLMLIWILKQ
jgi:hypothetical protein